MIAERTGVVSLNSDAVGALKRLRRTLSLAGVELPPRVATRTIVCTYGKGLMDIAYAMADRPAVPISELDALGYMLAEHDVNPDLESAVKRHYKRLYPESIQKNIYPSIIA